jgi:DNA polymerase III sliding clamp (beta) subunit (PCNA family)
MKDDLVRALEKVRCVVVDDVNACTSLSFSDDEGEGMCLSVDHRNNFAWETIAVNYTGVDLRAKFNLKFLLEAAKCLHTDSIYLKLYGGEECKSLVVTDEKGAHINVLLPLLR